MTEQQRARQAEDANLARREASKIQRAHPKFFGGLRVPVEGVAQALGLKVQKRSDLHQRAQLEVLTKNGEPDTAGTIAVRASLELNARRFAIAHEIGHAVLLRKQPQTAHEWEINRRELFANVFAAELLTSPEGRARIKATFPNLANPTDLLELASCLGLSPHALLTLATQDYSLVRGINKIWLRVKYVENAFTRCEPRLRIVSAHYDRDRFFVPTNQSIVRFAGDDRWLSSLPPGARAHYSTQIILKLKQPAPVVPKFLAKQLSAELSALRLRPSAKDQAPYFIVLAELTPSVCREVDGQVALEDARSQAQRRGAPRVSVH